MASKDFRKYRNEATTGYLYNELVDYGYDKHWVQPTWFGDGGLKREHVDRAIEILRGNL